MRISSSCLSSKTFSKDKWKWKSSRAHGLLRSKRPVRHVFFAWFVLAALFSLASLVCCGLVPAWTLRFYHEPRIAWLAFVKKISMANKEHCLLFGPSPINAPIQEKQNSQIWCRHPSQAGLKCSAMHESTCCSLVTWSHQASKCSLTRKVSCNVMSIGSDWKGKETESRPLSCWFLTIGDGWERLCREFY